MLNNEGLEQYRHLFKKKIKEGILALEDDLDQLKIPGFYYAMLAYCDGIKPTICLKLFEAFEEVLHGDYDTLHKMAKYFFVDSDDYHNRIYGNGKINYKVRDEIFNEIDEFITDLV